MGSKRCEVTDLFNKLHVCFQKVSLPDEPPEGGSDVITVILRTPQGRSFRRRVLQTDSVQVNYHWMKYCNCVGSPLRSSAWKQPFFSFCLIFKFPKKSYNRPIYLVHLELVTFFMFLAVARLHDIHWLPSQTLQPRFDVSTSRHITWSCCCVTRCRNRPGLGHKHWRKRREWWGRYAGWYLRTHLHWAKANTKAKNFL